MKVEFFCTNRGAHRRVDLGHSGSNWSPVIFSRRARNAPDRPFWDETGKWIGRRDPGQYARRTEHGKTVLRMYVTTWGDDQLRPAGTQFHCPKCARNPQRTMAELRSDMRGLKAAGITEVDISRLPF